MKAATSALFLIAATGPSVAAASTLSQPEHKVVMRLNVSPDGKIADCKVVGASDQPTSDEAICSKMTADATVRAPQPLPNEISTALRWNGDGSMLDRSYQPDDVRVILRPTRGQPWLAVQDYPDEILGGQSRRVEVRYLVGASGRIEQCRTRRADDAALTAWTCKLLTNRRVLPRVVDGEGRPASRWTESVFFWLPAAVRVCDEQDACFHDTSWTPDSYPKTE